MKRSIIAVVLTAILAVSVMVVSGATTASAATGKPPVEHPYVEIQRDGAQTNADNWTRVWHWYDPASITIYLNRHETWAAAYAGGLGSIVNAALGGTPFFGWLLSGYAWLAKVYYGWGYCLGIKLTLGGSIGYFPTLNHCYV